MYAASLLDLPCIVEAMKSWDKKGWYKTTDICQILLVLGRIEKEEQAKSYPLPHEVDKENWQYPHGLTPPMQWVRKRRFRKRVNRRHIERVEADVEELLKRDREFEDGAVDSTIEMQYVDPENPEDSDMDAEGDEEDYDMQYQDEDGNVYVDEPEAMDQDADADEHDSEMEAQLLAAMEKDDDDLEPGTSFVADPSMLQASPDTLHPLDTAVTPASGAATSVTEDDDDDEDDDEDDDDEVAEDEEDEEERATRQEREQIEGEIDDIKREIAENEAVYAKQTNPLLKNKVKGQLDKLRADLQVKQSGLGLSEED
jgi:transcription initiation factor TFIID subunit 7